MRTRLRSLWDRWRFLLTSVWAYALGAFGFVVGVLPMIWPQGWWVSGPVVLIAAVLGAVLFLKDTGALYTQFTGRKVGERLPPEVVDTYRCDELPVALRTQRGVLLINPAVDAALPTTGLTAVLDRRRYEVPDVLANLAPSVLHEVFKGRHPFNGPLLGLRTDLTPDKVADGGSVTLQRGDFFSSMCADELMAFEVTDGGDSMRLQRTFLVDRRGVLWGLGESQLSGWIGVSTLAITADDHLVLTLQSGKSQASRGLLAPSGSGSLEPRDLVVEGEPLVEVIARGANRELCEETRINPAWIGPTTVIGFARWLNRGGKPEFFCVTRLTCTAAELPFREFEPTLHGVFSDEHLWTDGARAIPVRRPPVVDDPSPSRAPLWSGAGVFDDAEVGYLDGRPQIGGKDVSAPLEAALDAWIRYPGRRSAE